MTKSRELECEHAGFTVNVEEREVRCTACGALLDPIGTLKDLETLVDEFDRKRRELDRQVAAQRDRQQFAIRKKTEKQLQRAREHCELCGGSGWAPSGPGRVVRCPCTKAIHALKGAR